MTLGINTSTIAFLPYRDFKKKFGQDSDRRKELSNVFEAEVAELLKYGVIRVFVGGSYLSDKANPADIDVVALLNSSVDVDALKALSLRAKAKGIDLLFCPDIGLLHHALNFLSTDRKGNHVPVAEILFEQIKGNFREEILYITDSIFKFKIEQANKLLQVSRNELTREALSSYISTLTKEFKQQSVGEFYSQCLKTEVSMPATHGKSDIQTNSLIGLFLDKKDDFSIIDFGCGQGRLIASLISLDTDILKKMTYFGVDFDVQKAQSYALDSGFLPLVNDICFLSFDELKHSSLLVDFIISINVMHEVPAKDMYDVLYLPTTKLKKDGIYVIHDMQRLPLGESGFVPWKSEVVAEFIRLLGFKVFIRNHTSKSGVPLFSLVISKPEKEVSKADFNLALKDSYRLLSQFYRELRSRIGVTERDYAYYSVVIANIVDAVAYLDTFVANASEEEI